MFCVKCGKEGDTFRGRCMDCFLEGRELLVLPPFVDLDRCTGCDEFLLSKKWRTLNDEEAACEAAVNSSGAIADADVIAVGAESERQDDRNIRVHVEADLDIDGHEVPVEAETVVRLKNTVCHRCSRQLGNYYEAVLQLRASHRGLGEQVKDDMLRKVLDKVEAASTNNRQMFVSKVQEMHGGLDFYLSSMSLSRGIARELAAEYGAEVKESSSLVGMKEGEETYRLTHLVRLPHYKLEDIVEHQGRPYQLMALSKRGGKLLSLENFQVISVRTSDLRSLKVLGGSDNIADAVVVACYDDEVQVLHPRDYSTVSLRIPAGLRTGDSVKVFDHEGVLLLVP